MSKLQNDVNELRRTHLVKHNDKQKIEVDYADPESLTHSEGSANFGYVRGRRYRSHRGNRHGRHRPNIKATNPRNCADIGGNSNEEIITVPSPIPTSLTSDL